MGANNTGLSTLITLSGADAFNEWMFGAIRPYVNGKILEIGSGIGNISSLFIRHHIPLFLSDQSDDYIARLRSRFAGEDGVKGFFSIDLATRDPDAAYPSLTGTFDTVFALNVVEHIQEESLAIKNCYKLLAPGGRLILLVPAWPGLYNRLDKELDHFRRYTTSTLCQSLSGYFNVVEMKYFNLAGIFGWWLTGSVLRRRILAPGQVKFYSRLVPLLRLADSMTFHRMGLSLIGVGEKKQ